MLTISLLSQSLQDDLKLRHKKSNYVMNMWIEALRESHAGLETMLNKSLETGATKL